jgi:pyruvate dehydrogenase E2 component (dihydrolipoamide acetyltransferase)
MPTDVVMPQMGESIFEGTITKWLKKAGDTVEKDEPLFEISTDKVDAEIPSPVAGVLSEIKVPEGATVQINTVVAVISESGSASGAGASVPRPSSATGKDCHTAGCAEGAVSRTAGAIAGGRIARIRPAPALLAAGAAHRYRQQPRPWPNRRHRLGRTHHQGRCTALPERARPGGPAWPRQRRTESRPTAGGSAHQNARHHRPAHGGEHADQPPCAYRLQSRHDAHRGIREREKARFERQNGVKLTYMPFIAAAAVEALIKFPIVNASLENGAIRYHRNINLGIAVALEWGLLVPVVKQAEGLSFLELARAIADLASRARAKKLMPDEATGSTFTLTNSGVFGDEFSTPIINQPESAILCISGLKKEAVVMTGAEGNDTIAIRSMQHFCLGFDHRLIDGADACKFMVEFKKTLEGWDKEIG